MVIGDPNIDWNSLTCCGAVIPKDAEYHWYHSAHYPQGFLHRMPEGAWLPNCQKGTHEGAGEDIKAAAICDRCWKLNGYCW